MARRGGIKVRPIFVARKSMFDSFVFHYNSDRGGDKDAAAGAPEETSIFLSPIMSKSWLNNYFPRVPFIIYITQLLGPAIIQLIPRTNMMTCSISSR